MRALRTLLVALLLIGAALAWIAWRNLGGEAPVVPREAEAALPVDAAQLERGGYLARAGNCAGCHTDRGGLAYAGGRGIDTPFGVVYASNLTPDNDSGLGRWSRSEFRRALHHGRSRDGRLLYPAFPYPHFTRITTADADALFAYLQSVPAVASRNRTHVLRFPYDQQAALAVWRTLFFWPAPQGEVPDPARGSALERGRYLVEGLGHCRACHGARNPFGALRGGGGGAVVTSQNWYAPSLAAPDEAGVADWSDEEVVALLATGVSPRGSALGPMAGVVLHSTQHLRSEDLRAMAQYLRALPQRASAVAKAASALPDTMSRGARLYDKHCADCHGEQGEGTPGSAPALAGNRSVTMGNGHNLIQVLRHGGFTPATVGNPRPYGMPPFGVLLDDAEIAAVASYVRQSWGQFARPVSPLDVLRTP
jgi:mono/diheme cytochrome c family protein